MKKYTALCDLALTVKVNGGSKHITFTSTTGGGSYLIVNDKALQEALESHPKYNILFKSKEIVESKPSKPSAEPAKKQEVQKLKFSDLGAARDYLADTFEVSRTKLRYQNAIYDFAKEHNIDLIIE